MYNKKRCTKCGIQLNNWNGPNKCMICGGKLVQVLPDGVRCPTCHSQNVIKVSQMRRSINQLAFGIANPTARSQFECQDCGNKW